MASPQSSRASSPLSTLSHTPERGLGNDNIEVRGTTTAKRTIDALNAAGNDTGDAGNDGSNDNGGPAKRVRIENEIADPAGDSGRTENHTETGPQTAPTSTAEESHMVLPSNQVAALIVAPQATLQILEEQLEVTTAEAQEAGTPQVLPTTQNSVSLDLDAETELAIASSENALTSSIASPAAVDLGNNHIAAQAASAAPDNHIDSNHVDEFANDGQSVVDSITAANPVAQAAAPLSDQHNAILPSSPFDNSHGQNKTVANVIATGSGPQDKIVNISLPSRYSGSFLPTLWSNKRAGICETLRDYRSHQGSLYYKDNIARGVLLDKEAERLDILSAQVAIFSV